MYSRYIIKTSEISNYSLQNQRDIALDTADNLAQIGQWALEGFQKEKHRTDLFLKLTRKNMKALETFPLSDGFGREFRKLIDSFEKLEEQYRSGTFDRKTWAHGILACGKTLSLSVVLL